MKQAYFFGCCPNMHCLCYLRKFAAHEERKKQKKESPCSLFKCYWDAQTPMHINWKTKVSGLHQKSVVAREVHKSEQNMDGRCHMLKMV